MGGVVFSASGNGSLGQVGIAITLAAGDQIPPGRYFSPVAWNAMVDGTLTAMPPGFVTSDGQATSAGGQIFPLGSKPEAAWPWPPAWPVGQPWFP